MTNHNGLTSLDRRMLLGGIATAGAGMMLSQSAAARSRPERESNGWRITTAAAPWQLGPVASRRRATDAESYDIEVLLDRPLQSIDGFGACFNEMGWDAIRLLSAADQNTVFAELFGESGAGFTLCRMPVGANDFARDWYSYDETPGDFALRDFSLRRDDSSLVPFIKAAQRVRPDLRLWASPWSPPVWMKTNGHYAALPNRLGWPNNGLTLEQQGAEGTDMFIQDKRYFDAYARYFGRFIDEYAARGVRIGMVMPQNEFNSPQVFPSCCWTPDGLARFMPYLGREMNSRGVEVFLGTLERPDAGLFNRIYEDAAAASFIRGIGVQWAGKGAVAELHNHHPTLSIYQSEQECGDGRNDWRYARYTWSLMKTFIENGANAYEYWNIALIQGGISRWGWAQNSLLTVDRTTRKFRWNYEYWLMKHLSAYVKPNARRLDVQSWTGYGDILSFRNPDGSIAIIAHNPLSHRLPIRIKIGEFVYETVLPPDCFASLTI